MKIKRIYLKKKRTSLHPWIFSKMVNHPNPKYKPGTLVEVYDKEKKFVGYGFYNPTQTIAIRLISYKKEQYPSQELIFNKLLMAKEFREHTLKLKNSYRLIFGEADGLSGVVIDKFNDIIVIEPYSAGIITISNWLVNALSKLYPKHIIGFKINENLSQKENIDFSLLAKEYPLPKQTIITENNLKFIVNFDEGHKTGFFLDQRKNRSYIAQFAENKVVFDLFSYTGAFGLNCLLNNAKEVYSVDLDEKAVDLIKKNAELNNLPQKHQKHHVIHQDAFDFLRSTDINPDIIILDPSKFLAHKNEYSVALKKYGDINKLAISKVKHGGLIATFSCSGMLSLEKFLDIIKNSAREANRIFQIIKIDGAAEDHPILSTFPESFYLKAVFLRVLDNI